MTDRTWGWLAAVIDVVLIVVFALIGRSSHGETNSLGALWTTAYPFLAGWAIAYVTSGAWARPLRAWPTGIVAWILTVFVGMAIRVATGQGVVDGNPLPLSFLIVATIVLGVFLLGWRAIARFVLRTVARRRGQVAPALDDPTTRDPAADQTTRDPADDPTARDPAADPSTSPGVTPGT
ncbi:DUF3054 domain-containing protein [Curtobacterium sp. MCBA15_001]|uniref:DUF3054 domain-containing protein n=1 Tax=Curtobacterium sp. MCBA15_001 TaxID=1898731 RepID=UPI0008DDBFF6|nr:DUF3054 domain-containing protein [Curtobacterium sp. MCBA15_001]OIH96692.1 hypothetical protein BIU90_16500 [Curtobacterium sp. MCBA15_001]